MVHRLKFLFLLFILHACHTRHVEHFPYRSDGCIIYEKPSRKLVYQSVTRHSYKIKMSDSAEVEHFYKKNGDSVAVHKNGILLAVLKLTNHSLLGTHFLEYDSAGTLRKIDSLGPSDQGAKKRYFNTYYATNVKVSKTFYPNGKLSSVLYFSNSGADSLYKDWYGNGVIKSLKRFKNDSALSLDHYPHHSRKPIESLEYHANGRLAKKEKTAKNYSAQYRETGMIKFLAFDTLISRQKINCVKNYYPNGYIKSIQYFKNETPCCTWLEYSKTGGVISSVQKTDPGKIPGWLREEAAPELFLYVEQNAEYPGGTHLLKKFFEDKLQCMTVKYPDLLGGNYSLLFEVSKTGKTVFIDVKGFEANSIKDDLKRVVESMPAWRPGKRNGRAISESFEIILSTD